MSVNVGRYSNLELLRASQALFRKNLRYLLDMRSLTATEVARETGVSSLARYAGYFEYDVSPSLRTIVVLATYFRINPGGLIGRDLEKDGSGYGEEE